MGRPVDELVQTLRAEDNAGGAMRDSRNVVNWLSQVGFLMVSAPMSLIQGFSTFGGAARK
jgi:hypothetical protein